jgi:type I restriction enzyme R subunit
VLNEKFGTEFTGSDKLFFDQIEEDMLYDEVLKRSVQNNTKENFKYVFDEVFLNKAIERMTQNQEIFAKIMDDMSFQDTVKGWLLQSVYEKLQHDVSNG